MLETDPKLPSEFGGRELFEEAQKQFLGNWIWRATHALLDHQDFNFSGSWISEKLGISIEESVDALDGLTTLGLVQRTENGYEKRKIQFLFPEELESNDFQLKKHVSVSQQILNKMTPESKHIYSLYFAASNARLVTKLHSDFKNLFDQFLLDSQQSEKDGIYGLTFSAVNLVNNIGPKGDC